MPLAHYFIRQKLKTESLVLWKRFYKPGCDLQVFWVSYISLGFHSLLSCCYFPYFFYCCPTWLFTHLCLILMTSGLTHFFNIWITIFTKCFMKKIVHKTVIYSSVGKRNLSSTLTTTMHGINWSMSDFVVFLKFCIVPLIISA